LVTPHFSVFSEKQGQGEELGIMSPELSKLIGRQGNPAWLKGETPQLHSEGTVKTGMADEI
jgi:hypothetical protein